MTLRQLIQAAGFLAAVLPLSVLAQDLGADTSSIKFTARILETESPGSSGIAASADTVLYRLYYVDAACSKYEYFFRQEGNTLTIRRLTLPPDTCFADSEMIYGVEGEFRGVPPGKYLLELRNMVHGRDEVLWHDVVSVGRQNTSGGRKGRR